MASFSVSTYNRLNLHVSASPRQVIRAARTKLRPAGKSRAQRGARHIYLRDMLSYHADARALYRAVATGFYTD